MSDSLPPHLLRRPGTLPGTAPRGRQAAAPQPVQVSGQQDQSPPVLLAAPGRPGRYEPPAMGTLRPRNITDLRARVTPATPEPWPAATYVLIGKNGRRAHWNGTDWKLKESPGYAGETATVRSEPEQLREVSAR